MRFITEYKNFILTIDELSEREDMVSHYFIGNCKELNYSLRQSNSDGFFRIVMYFKELINKQLTIRE